jgi:hypothetical protein
MVDPDDMMIKRQLGANDSRSHIHQITRDNEGTTNETTSISDKSSSQEEWFGEIGKFFHFYTSEGLPLLDSLFSGGHLLFAIFDIQWTFELITFIEWILEWAAFLWGFPPKFGKPLHQNTEYGHFWTKLAFGHYLKVKKGSSVMLNEGVIWMQKIF